MKDEKEIPVPQPPKGPEIDQAAIDLPPLPGGEEGCDCPEGGHPCAIQEGEYAPTCSSCPPDTAASDMELESDRE